LDYDKNIAEISAALKADTISPEGVRFIACQNPDVELKGYYHLLSVIIILKKLMELLTNGGNNL